MRAAGAQMMCAGGLAGSNRTGVRRDVRSAIKKPRRGSLRQGRERKNSVEVFAVGGNDLFIPVKTVLAGAGISAVALVVQSSASVYYG